MLRIIFVYILPFILPTVLYVLWAKKYGKKEIPFLTLIVTGAILLGLAIGAVSLWEESSPAGSSYQAPKYQNGKIIPAQVTEKSK